MGLIYSVDNLKGQKLDSERLIQILNFCANNYAGLVNYSTLDGEEYITTNSSDNTVTLYGSWEMLINGIIFRIEHSVDDVSDKIGGPYELPFYNDGDDEPYNLLGLIIDIDSIKNDDHTITNNRLHDDSITISNGSANISSFGFYRIKGFNIEKYENNDAYYNITPNDTYKSQYGNDGWDAGFDFTTKKFTNLVTSDNVQKSGYLIPVAAVLNEDLEQQHPTIISLLPHLTKKNHEEFMSDLAQAELMSKFNNKFVWKAGGKVNGKIGNLYIHNNTIGSLNNDEIILDSLNIKFKRTTLKNKTQSGGSGGYFLPVSMGNDGKIYRTQKISVENGGTGSTHRNNLYNPDGTVASWGAKHNLGFYSGKGNPNNITTDTIINAAKGDIFFRIVE